VVDSFAKGIYRKRRESETSAAGQKCSVQFVRIVCDYAESGVRSIPVLDTGTTLVWMSRTPIIGGNAHGE